MPPISYPHRSIVIQLWGIYSNWNKNVYQQRNIKIMAFSLLFDHVQANFKLSWRTTKSAWIWVDFFLKLSLHITMEETWRHEILRSHCRHVCVNHFVIWRKMYNIVNVFLQKACKMLPSLVDYMHFWPKRIQNYNNVWTQLL